MPTPTPDNYPGAPGAPLYAGLPTPAVGALLATVQIDNTSSGLLTDAPVTFGHPFKSGEWDPATHSLRARIGSTPIPCHVDEVATHVDGSVYFAVISVELPSLAGNSTADVELYTAALSAYPAGTPPSEPDWNMSIEVDLYSGETLLSTQIASAQDELERMISEEVPRLDGEVAVEYTVVVPFKDSGTLAVHPHLEARFHVRMYKDGALIRTEAIIENCRLFTTSPSDLSYVARFKKGATTLHTEPKFTHHARTRWRKIFWTGGTEPPLRVRHDMAYFIATRAIPNYDLSITVPEADLAGMATSLASSDTGPMGNVSIEHYFPTTGARADIGPLPEWSARYVLSQDDRARALMMANANASGTVPMHFRDETYDQQPLDISQYPNITTRFGTSSPAIPAASTSTPYSVDTPHQPTLVYLPYLLTGDAFLQDEMMFWASYNVSIHNPATGRQGALGLVYSDEIRGGAWTMRTLGETALTLPDAHPKKSFYEGLLANNLTWYATNYTPGSAYVSPLGAIIKTHESVKITGPWQNDFMGIVISRLVALGVPNAATMLGHINTFNLGRFQNQGNGFCVSQASSSYVDLDDAGDVMFTTWAAFFAHNYPSINASSCPTVADPNLGFPEFAGGHAAVARAMLASLATAGVSGALTAYNLWKSFTPDMDAEYPGEPTWAIVPAVS